MCTLFGELTGQDIGIIEQEILPRLIELEAYGSPIKKLKINNDYLNLLKDANIFTLEDLVETNTRDISDGTGLSIEKIIEFRNKAKKILKSI